MTETRVASDWPFDVTSFWNTPIGSGVTVGTVNSALAGASAQINYATFSTPVNVGGSADPSLTVRQVAAGTWTPGQGDTVLAHEPGTIVLSGDMQSANPVYNANGSISFTGTPDGFMALIDSVAGTATESYKTCWGNGGASARILIARTGTVRTWNLTDVNPAGARASGLPFLGGLIRAWELTKAATDPLNGIRHALAMALPAALLLKPSSDSSYPTPGHQWPATSQDSDANTSYSGAIRMGTQFVLDPAYAFTSAGLSNEGLALAYALHDYGAYVTDRSSLASLYGEQALDPTAAARMKTDWATLIQHMVPVTNNDSTNIGGPGTRVRPLAPAFATGGAVTSIVRTQTGQTASTGASLTLTYTETPALDATNGHILMLRSQAGSSANPAPLTPSGWTLIGSSIATNGTYTVRLDFFGLQGDGVTNGVTIAGTTSTNRHACLQALDGISAPTFWTGFVKDQANTNRTSVSFTVGAATNPNAVDLVASAVSGTAGGTGFAWTPTTGLTTGFGGTSSSSSLATRGLAEPTAASQAFTATWTTSGLGVGAGVSVGGAPAATAASATGTLSLAGTAPGAAAATAAGALALAGAGDTSPPSSATGVVVLAGSAPASANAAGSGVVTLAGAGNANATAVASGTVTLAGTTAPTASGAGVGSIGLTGSSTTTAAAAGTGTLTLTGSASAGQGAAATGTVTLTASAATTAADVAAGTLTLTASTTASARAPGTGIVSLSGNASTGLPAAAVGGIALTGAAAATTGASAAGTLTLAAVAVGRGLAAAAAAITLAGAALGRVAAAALGILNLTGTATASDGTPPTPITVQAVTGPTGQPSPSGPTGTTTTTTATGPAPSGTATGAGPTGDPTTSTGPTGANVTTTGPEA